MLNTEPTSWIGLIAISVVMSLCIRVLNFVIRSKDSDTKDFRSLFLGKEDLWLPFFIGSLEVAAYSLLIKADLAPYIGAWLAFKTVNRWHYNPNVTRGLFNRYLFSNALVLVAAFILAKNMYL